MTVFAERLRARIDALGLSHADVARRAGLDPRRFGHYTTGHREPDFRTLLKISEILATTPDELLGVGEHSSTSAHQAELIERIQAACSSLSPEMLNIILVQVSAVADLKSERRQQQPERRIRKVRRR